MNVKIIIKCSLILMLITYCSQTTAWAQTPQAISYQSVVRDLQGNILKNKAVTFRISILQGSTTGTAVYTETHALTTNALGLVNLQIGKGKVVAGTFTKINWASGSYFSKVEIDLTNGSNYTEAGTSQILSVPYSLYAQKTDGISSYTRQQILQLTPSEGLLVYNTSDNLLLFYSNGSWHSLGLPDCSPLPTYSFAGTDQMFTDGTTNTVLSANNPVVGKGQWSVISGDGGTFADATNPNTSFAGNLCQTYTLAWSISTACGTNKDEVIVQYISPVTEQAEAGQNQGFYDSTVTTTLAANTPITGVGKWTVFRGEGGSFDDDTNPNTRFSGILCQYYTLQWSITNGCNTSSDYVVVYFTPSIYGTSAGEDQFILDSNLTVSLSAIKPYIGEGKWSVESGNGGTFADVTSPTTTFTGLPCSEYILRWTVSTGCSTVFDDIYVRFAQQPTTPIAGADQKITDGSVTATLTANTPIIGTGKWIVYMGLGGSFADATSPNTTFTGAKCSKYTLIWEISNDCWNFADDIIIEFIQAPTAANAGADQIFTDGSFTTTLAANTPTTGIGKWTIVSGTGGSFANATSPNTIFTGVKCSEYLLRWEIGTDCGVTMDEVKIVFTQTPTTANAGADQFFTDGSVTTTLTANAPISGIGTWTVLSGANGSFANATSATTVLTGVLHEKYILKWTIATQCSSSSDEVVILFGKDEPGNTITDIDSNVYNTVYIGTQQWMAKNLYVTKFNDGTAIPNIIDYDYYQPAYCWYNNDAGVHKTNYGALYNWYVVDTVKNGKKNVCPSGWHVPTSNEWATLLSYVGANAGEKLRATTLWQNPNGATNASGFTVLPGGYRNFGWSDYLEEGTLAYFWSSTLFYDVDAGTYLASIMLINDMYADTGHIEQSSGASVRCLKD